MAPSEDVDKVIRAIRNVVRDPSAEPIRGSRQVRLTSDDPVALTTIHDQIRDRHVRGAARKLLYSALKGSVTSLMLNKQAAFVGVVALCGNREESPLGPIFVSVESSQIEAVIDWLTAYGPG